MQYRVPVMALRSSGDQICLGECEGGSAHARHSDPKITDLRIAGVCSNDDALLDTRGIAQHTKSMVYAHL